MSRSELIFFKFRKIDKLSQLIATIPNNTVSAKELFFSSKRLYTVLAFKKIKVYNGGSQRGTWKILLGHGDLRHYEPSVVEKCKGATSRSLSCSFCENEEIRGSFNVMTFFLFFSCLLGKLYCPPKYFFDCYSSLSPMGDIRILEVIRLEMAKKGLRNTDLECLRGLNLRKKLQVEPPQSVNHWTLDLPDHEKFRTIGGPQNILYIHVITLHYAVQA